MNRKIMMSGLSIISALTLLGGTAFAAFTSSATATNNTFASATPLLFISTNLVDFGATEPGFSATGLIPGSNSGPKAFKLRNANSGADLPVTMKLVNLPANTLPGADVTIDAVCTGHGVESHSYNDWISTGYVIGTVGNNLDLDCSMTVKLNDGVGNEDAGKAAVFDAVFTGTEGI